MPLKEGKSDEAVGENIKRLMHEALPTSDYATFNAMDSSVL